RIPTENIARPTRTRSPTQRTRPMGSPRKIVKPAIAPRPTVSLKSIERLGPSRLELGSPNIYHSGRDSRGLAVPPRFRRESSHARDRQGRLRGACRGRAGG